MRTIEGEQLAPVAIDVGATWQGLAAQPLVGALDIERGVGICAAKGCGQLLAGRASQHHRSQAQFHGKSRAKSSTLASSGNWIRQNSADFQKKPEKRVEFRSHAIEMPGRVADGTPHEFLRPHLEESALTGFEVIRGTTSVPTTHRTDKCEEGRHVLSIVVDRAGGGSLIRGEQANSPCWRRRSFCLACYQACPSPARRRRPRHPMTRPAPGSGRSPRPRWGPARQDRPRAPRPRRGGASAHTPGRAHGHLRHHAVGRTRSGPARTPISGSPRSPRR